MANRLAAESSPYLLQHADNPVDWYPWGDAAFERARSEDRPVLLSVGYSACHWCHVMAHELFENAGDRGADERALREHQGRPRGATRRRLRVHGRRPGDGRPGRLAAHRLPDTGTDCPSSAARTSRRTTARACTAFRPCCRPRPAAYHAQRDEIGAMGEKVREAVAPRSLPAAGEPTAALLDAAARKLASDTDRAHGGFGAAPKFPHPQALDLMLRRSWATGDALIRDAAVLTPRRDVARRHPRPGWRWLPSIQRRRALVGAALREDALRQRAARSRVPARVPGERARGHARGLHANARLHGARAAPPRRRVRRVAGCRQSRR